MAIAPPEVDEVMRRAKSKVLALMAAGESGTVVIGYANGSLRIEVHSHEPPIKIDTATRPIVAIK